MKLCECCSKEIKKRKNGTISKKYCSPECFWESIRKLRGGETKIVKRFSSKYSNSKSFSYEQTYSIKYKKYKLTHRLVMEKKMGRKLKKPDVVHHINQDTLDNRVENLRVFESNEDNRKIHGRAMLMEDHGIFRSIELDHLYNIFGIRKTIFLSGCNLKGSYRYGKPTIVPNVKNRHVRSYINEKIDNMPEYKCEDFSQNCLVLSEHYIKRVVLSFYLNTMLLFIVMGEFS